MRSAGAGGVRPGTTMGLPLHVGAQERDSQQEVHHDRAHHHGQPQQYGPVFSSFQSCDCFPFVQEVMIPDFLVNISEVENNTFLCEVRI